MNIDALLEPEYSVRGYENKKCCLMVNIKEVYTTGILLRQGFTRSLADGDTRTVRNGTNVV